MKTITGPDIDNLKADFVASRYDGTRPVVIATGLIPSRSIGHRREIAGVERGRRPGFYVLVPGHLAEGGPPSNMATAMYPEGSAGFRRHAPTGG